MKQHRLVLFSAVTFVLLAAFTTKAQDRPPERAADNPNDPIVKIKTEGMDHSKVMETAEYLTDVIGPRLTNSPGMKRANEWTRDTMTKWGLVNAHLEPWGPYGRGWSLVQFSAQVVEPLCIPLIAFPKAWSPGTNGKLQTPVVHLDPKTEDEVDSYKGRIGGKIVLLGDIRETKTWFEPMAKRYDDTQLLEMANAQNPTDPNATGARRPGMRRPQGAPGGPGGDPEMAKRMAIRRKVGELLKDEPPALLIEPSTIGEAGTLFVYAASVEPGSMSRSTRRAWNKDTPAPFPQIVMATEHFNRIVRMLRHGEPVVMSVDLQVAFHDDDLMGYNTVAEIPGTEKAGEVVMLGGHMDSWHGGTGATDNAAGCAVAMEAARIIKTLDLKPKRTIRVALWSGEEQGLMGSAAYVKEHFGEVKTEPLSAAVGQWVAGNRKRSLVKKPDYDSFCAYFNFDNGTGKIRGIHLEGNQAAEPILRRWFAPFREQGAGTMTLTRTGGTDHMSFDAIGLPGFQFIQDSIDYDARTHHSNMDVFDRLQADDLKQASVIMATMVYQAAMADDKMPRKPEPKD